MKQELNDKYLEMLKSTEYVKQEQISNLLCEILEEEGYSKVVKLFKKQRTVINKLTKNTKGHGRKWVTRAKIYNETAPDVSEALKLAKVAAKRSPEVIDKIYEIAFDDSVNKRDQLRALELYLRIGRVPMGDPERAKDRQKMVDSYSAVLEAVTKREKDLVLEEERVLDVIEAEVVDE